MKKYIMIAGIVVLSSINFAPLSFSQEKRVQGLFPTPTPTPVQCNYTLMITIEYPVYYPEGEPQYTAIGLIVPSSCDQNVMQAEAKKNAEDATRNGFWYGDTFYSSHCIFRVKVMLNYPS